LIVAFHAQHYFMRNHHNDPSKFETDNSMSIVVYDEKKDDWAKILYTDALHEACKHCFDGNGNLMTDMANPPPDYIFSCRDTNFKGDNSHQFTGWWGMLEQGGNEHCSHLPDYLPLECLRAHCASVEAKLGERENLILQELFQILANSDENDENGFDFMTARTSLGDYAAAGIMALAKFYPALEVGGSGDSVQHLTKARALFANLVFPRPVLYDSAEDANETTPVDQTFLDRTFGTGIALSSISTDLHEQRAFMYMFEKDGLTKTQVKNFRKEILKKPLKDSFEAAMKATKGDDVMRDETSMAATTGDGVMRRSAGKLLTRAAIKACQREEKDFFIQWRKPGGTAGLLRVKDIASELLEAFPPMGTNDVVAFMNQIIATTTATAHLGEEFSVGSKRPASSANASWSKRAATDASSYMQGIGARFDEIRGRAVRGVPTRADVEKMDKHKWVLSSDHALFHAQNKVQHFARKVGSLSTPIQRLAAHMLYWSKVTKASITAWSVNNIVPPFSICVARPYMTYDMCTCILMKGGSDTGATFQGHSDFQLGDDVQSKIHYGNYVSMILKILRENHKVLRGLALLDREQPVVDQLVLERASVLFPPQSFLPLVFRFRLERVNDTEFHLSRGVDFHVLHLTFALCARPQTYYSKAVVTNHKNIIHARNVFCNGYVDGDDTDFIKMDGRGERESGSLFAFIVPYNEHAKSNPMRLFSESEVDPHVRPEHRFGRTMTGGLYYREKLNVNHNMRVGGDQFTTLSEQNDSNDITYQGHQFFWKEHRESGVNGSYTGCIVNTGHWGRDVYPGCGRVRNGEEVYFEKQHHGQDVY
jgi:hypothetical protein